MIEERVNLITEYIEQIISDNITKPAKINIDSNYIDGIMYKTLDIEVLEKNFERHFNLDITMDQETEFYKRLLDTFIEKYANSETVGISKYYNKWGFVGDNFSGIDISSIDGKLIKFSFKATNLESSKVIDEYNKKLFDYINDNKETNIK